MTQHAHEALPRLAFFIAQRPTQVGDDDELVREPTLPKRAAPDLDTPRRTRAIAAGKKGIDDAARLAVEEGLQPEIGCLDDR